MKKTQETHTMKHCIALDDEEEHNMKLNTRATLRKSAVRCIYGIATLMELRLNAVQGKCTEIFKGGFSGFF